MRIPQSFLFSKLNKPNSPSIFFSHKGDALALWLSLWPPSGPASATTHPSCAGAPGPGWCSTSDGASKSAVEGDSHHPLPAGQFSFDATQDMYHWILSSFWMPKSFPMSLLSVNPSAVCTSPRAASCTWPCWTSFCSLGPTFQACPGTSGWCPSLLLCQLHHSAWCCLWTDAQTSPGVGDF